MGFAFEAGASGLPDYCTSSVCVPEIIGALPVWISNQKKQIHFNKQTYFMSHPGRLITVYSMVTSRQLPAKTLHYLDTLTLEIARQDPS